MSKQFKFPDIGEGITEGEIVKWIVKEGDRIKEDQILGEIETDKAIVEIPSPYEGTILKLHFKQKDIVKVGDVLVTIGEKGEAVFDEPEKEIIEAEIELAPSVVGEIKETREEIKEVLATPRVRKLALELEVDIKEIKGSGPQGRITEDDVKQAKKQKAAAVEIKPAIKVKAKYDFYGYIDHIPLRGVRRATAQRMRESLSKAAHVTHFDEADVTELTKTRVEMKKKAAEEGIKLTYLPFIVKGVVNALKDHPMLNATLDEENQEIVVKKYYNIGIAVDIPDGLIVPVVKAADQKSIFELAAEIQKLAEATKKRTIDLADLKGGTFSITNVGMIGGEAATPIINYPEVAILATLKISPRARVEGANIVVKNILPLCLSFDHRVIDGAEAARFTIDLVKFLENPKLLFTE
ncbi:dihydrolipoamide acetyltransferase family protein [Acidobacteriota bacterium]